MTVAAQPRAAADPSGALLSPRPMRRPDTSDERVMTRRGWWLLVLNWLIPGSAQSLAGSRRLGRFGLASTLLLWVVIALGVAAMLLWRNATTTFLLHPFVLAALAVLLVAYVVVWIVLTLDTLRLVRLVKTRTPGRYLMVLLAIVLMVVPGAIGAYAAPRLLAASNAINAIFHSGSPVEPSDGYYNILLLGADSGDGRDSLRYDSISVVSVNADTGAVTIFGLPREMPDVPFAEGSPMQAIYPNGFEGHADSVCGWNPWLNHVRQAAEVCRDDKGTSLYPEAAENGSTPGLEATEDAVAGILGIEIEYHVLIDMNGFAALIDALGGVEIEVSERLPEGPGPAYQGQAAEDWATGWIESGTQVMDGDTAQWYARSRYTTSDWDRMQRQRQLQEAILAQFTPQNVLDRFQEIAEAGDDLVQTDIPRAMLTHFLDLGLKAREQPFTSVEMTPADGIDDLDPDYAMIREMVSETLHPVSEGEDGSGGEGDDGGE